MPATAEWEGVKVTTHPTIRLYGTVNLTDAEVTSARRDGEQFKCPSCGGRMHIRKSTADTPEVPYYFVHNPGEGLKCLLRSGGGESTEHLNAKFRAAAAISRRSGWEAQLERQGDGCIPDVVAINVKKAMQLPIEIQLAYLNSRDATERSRRALGSFAHQPLWLQPAPTDWSYDVPSLRYEHGDTNAKNLIGLWADNRAEEAAWMRYDDTIGAWLSGDLMHINQLGIVATEGRTIQDGKIISASTRPNRKTRTVAKPHMETPWSGALVCSKPGQVDPTTHPPRWLRGSITATSGETSTFDCPRCSNNVTEEFYGPCQACRQQLRGDAA